MWMFKHAWRVRGAPIVLTKAESGAAQKTTDQEGGVTLHQKSIYSWFFTLPQQCRQRCTVCTFVIFSSPEHFDTPE